ncbi:MAG: alpha-glucosidase [Bacillota bacterium]
MEAMIAMQKWWETAIGYQIYPKSFMDSNGDGIGDLQGIIDKLDYLEDLGITLVWICPIFKSPQVDHGYDVSDYTEIEEMYGSKEVLKTLVDEAYKRNIRVILDLVVNHTSNQHHWFQEALKDPNGKYGKYYIFEKGTKEAPPNNWTGIFNGSTWEKVGGAESDLYYLHIFTTEQPDLNWENYEMRQEIYKIINDWLDFGVAGFRVDAISHIKKNFDYEMKTSDRSDGMYFALEHFNNCEGIEELLQEMKRESFAKHDCFTVGEVNSPTIEQLDLYAGKNGHFNSVFDFSHTLDGVERKEFIDDQASYIEFMKEKVFNVQKNISTHTTMANIIENHDLCRAIDRNIPKKYRNFHSSAMMGTINFFMRGIPFIYQGQEIGMRNYLKKSIEEFKDPTTLRQYEELVALGQTPEEALAFVNLTSREHSRTPMQWNGKKNAGFTEGEPWFSVNPNYKKINVEAQLADKNSLLQYYKDMILLRKRYEYPFVYGRFIPIFEEVKGIIAYKREDITILNNCTSKKVKLDIHIPMVLLSNYDDVETEGDSVVLQPFQSVVFL